MTHRGIEPNGISYSAGFSACEKGGQMEKARDFLQEMTGRGIELDNITFIRG